MLHETSDGAVLVDLGTEGCYGIDEVGTRMLQLLDENGDVAETVAALLQEYDVQEAQLRADLEGLIQRLAALGLVVAEG